MNFLYLLSKTWTVVKSNIGAQTINSTKEKEGMSGKMVPYRCLDMSFYMHIYSEQNETVLESKLADLDTSEMYLNQ